MRYLSLDFLRGLTIALMVIVNNPGTWTHVFPPLRHAAWHGCTPTDLVFPFFLFVVGVSMFFSFSAYKGKLDAAISHKILKRIGLIFLIGLLLNAFPFWGTDYYTLRVMGVLQRIALAYGLAAFLCAWLSRRNLIIAAAAILFGYWLALFLGGGSNPYELANNLCSAIDMAVLTPEHLYKGFGIPFDPEGLLGSFPAACTVIIGYLTGGIISEKGADKDGLVMELLTYGAILSASGFVWGQMFPINKALWTSSYVFFAGGLAMITLSACVWILDVKGWQRAAKPFLVFGANPLFAFVLSGLFYKTMALFTFTDFDGKQKSALYWIYRHIFYPIEQYQLGSFLYALWFGFMIWLACWILYRRKIYIKI